MTSQWPIIVVTGANGGVGYGICQRLLIQFCSRQPPDSLPQRFVIEYNTYTPDPTSIPAPEGLTLVMACRSVKRAEVARKFLYNFLDQHIARLEKGRGAKYDGHADKVRKNVKIEIEELDLASVRSVEKAGVRIGQKYPYVSHLICNAGLQSFERIVWLDSIKQFFTDPLGAITTPKFYIQQAGELSLDGLGWVWQCNVFGHFVLYRALEQSLTASRCPYGSRVIWMSSLAAQHTFWDQEKDDWQLKMTAHSYESSKYQIDLISTHLDEQSLQSGSPNPIRHLIAQPGVCSTNVAAAIAGPVLDIIKVILFYIGRLLGSPNHPIDPYKAAISAVHLALVPLPFVTFFIVTGTTGRWKRPPVRFGAETDMWGKSRVGLSEVKQWELHRDDAKDLVKKCDDLIEKFHVYEDEPREIESVSENM